MFRLSSDESFHFELLRVLSAARYFGSDIAEVLQAASEITPGSFSSFSAVFEALADHVLSRASSLDPATNPISAQDAYFRAASYFRSADFYIHGNQDDPRIQSLWKSQTAAFDKAIALLPIPGKRVLLNTEGFEVPAIFYGAAGTGPKPTVILGNGYDGAQEEMLHVMGFAALERGLNVITYEGPGQPSVVRNQNLGFISGWEKVVTPVVDYLGTLEEVDMSRLGLVGYSMGGFLAVRAAAFEPRIAAVMAIDGVYDVHGAFSRAIGPELSALLELGDKAKIDRICDEKLAGDGLPSVARWGMEQGLWSFNTKSVSEFMERTKGMTLKGLEGKIRCPVWLGDAEDDLFFKGQPEEAKNALGDKATLVKMGGADVAGAHCHVGASVYANQVILDWFQKVISGK